MSTVTGFAFTPRRVWLLGLLVPAFLTACATSPRAEGDLDMVDIGYGEVDANTAGGSVEVVDGDDVPVERVRTVADMLRNIPGVRVWERGGVVTVRIRGGSSFMAGEEPLVILDGMEYRGNIGGINPRVIDTISILKNAEDTAVYGAKGANGVILIKTKTGMAGGS